MKRALQFEIPSYEKIEAEEYLKRYAPWRMLVSFSSGPSSDQYEIFEPFNRRPLFKLEQVIDRLKDRFPGAKVLDIGANRGHNTIFLAHEHGCRVTAIDSDPKHKAAVEELVRRLNLEVDYRLEDAERFCLPNAFDVILHLGVLYHLPDPLASLSMAAKSLAPGGIMVIETVENISEDPFERASIKHIPGDNHWAIGAGEIKATLDSCGSFVLEKVRDGRPPQYDGLYSRPIYLAEKAVH